MNHIYRLVWNQKRRMLVAVAEVGNTQGKEGGGKDVAATRAAGGMFPGARTLMAAAMVSLFPVLAMAQGGNPHVIDAGTTEYLSDGNGSNAAAAGWILHNDGGLDISATDAGTSVQSLSGSGTVLLGERLLTLTDAQGFFAGTIQGSGGLAITGGLEILSGSNVYLGATTVGGESTLALAGSGSIALSSALVNNGVFDIAATDRGATLRSLAGADSGSVLLGGQTLTLSAASDEYAGTIRGDGGLTVGGGFQVLSGANGYTGATVIADGATLALSGSGSIALSSGVHADGVLDLHAVNAAEVRSLSGSGTVLLGAPGLTLSAAGDDFGGVISGNGGLTVAGGTQVLSGVNTYTGATTIGSDGTLALSGNGAIASSSGLLNNGVFDIAATHDGAALTSLSGSGAVLLGGQTLTLTQANDVFAGAMHGSGGLTLASGTLLLTGEQHHTGVTTIAAPAWMSLADQGSLASSRSVAVDGTLDLISHGAVAELQSLSGSGAVLVGSSNLTITNANDRFDGTIIGSGGLTVNGGNQVLGNVNNYRGLTTIADGARLSLAESGAIALSSGVVAHGVFDISGTVSGATVRNLAGGGNVVLGGNTLTLSSAFGQFQGAIDGSGGLAIDGGHLALSGVNSYSGDTTIAQGAVLSLSGDGRIANSAVRGSGTLDIAASNGNAAVKGLGDSGTVLLGGQTLKLTDANDFFSGQIEGSGGILLAGGMQAISTAQAYTGQTVVAAGADLMLWRQGSIANSSLVVDGRFDAAYTSSDITVRSLGGAGSVLLGNNDLHVTDGAGHFSGNIAGSGGLSLSGGTLSLSGANSYLGKTVVSNAVLRTVADANLGLGNSALELANGTWQTGADLTHTRGLLLAGRGTVDVDAATTTVETGMVGGSGALVKAGDGTLVLNGVLANSGGVTVKGGTLALGATNTHTGTTTVANGGVLRIDRDANLGDKANRLVIDGGTLQTTGSMDSARSIGIGAVKGTIDTLGAESVVTLSGNIDGAGRIVKEGAGTLVLAGDNAGGRGAANKYGDGWTGGLTINAGLVKVTNAWGLGWGSVLTFNGGTILATVDIATGQNIQVGRSTDINVVSGTTTTLTGDLISSGAGDGCFNKTGQGTLNVLGSARIDSTCVLEGKLLANGAFASRVTVARGATLGGAGSIQGDILVQGTLSPGNSPGMLTADSQIVMATGSTYKEDIGGATQASSTTPIGVVGYYSYLHVVGGKQFTIQPGVTLAPALKDLYTPNEAGYGSAAYVPQLGQTFRIITADGGINGRFDTLAQPDGLAQDTRMAAFYNQGGNNSIELKVLPKSYASWRQDANGNSRSVGAALDTIVDLDAAGKASAAQTTLLYNTASYGASELGGVVQGLSGELHGALAASQPQAAWDLQRTLLKRGEANDGRALWLDLGAGHAKWSADAAASGFDADRFQATVGFDLLQAPGLRLGLGVSHTGTDLDAEGGKGKLRQNKLFAYGEKAVGAMVFDASASHGRDKLESHRADPFAAGASLAGNASGSSSLLGAGVRLPRVVDGATLEPFARLSVQRVERDAMTEASASGAALALERWSATGSRVVAGLGGASRNADPLQASTWRFNLGAGVDGGDLLRPRLGASLAGTRFDIAGPDVGRAFVQGGLNGTLQLKKGAYLFVGVTGEARSGYYTVGGNAGVRAQF